MNFNGSIKLAPYRLIGAINNCINFGNTDVIANQMQEIINEAECSYRKSLIAYAINEIVECRHPDDIALFASTVALNNPDLTSFIKEQARVETVNHWGNNHNEGGQEHYQAIIAALDKVWSEEPHVTRIDESYHHNFDMG